MNSNTICNIYNNVYEWIEDIGYEYTNDSKKKLSEMDIKKMFSFYPHIKLEGIKRKKDSVDEHLIIYIILDKEFVSKSDNIIRLLNSIKHNNSRVIIITHHSVKIKIDKILKKVKTIGLKILHYPYYLFKVDIRNNIMVGKHSICTKEEEKEVMKLNNITNKNQFPKIFITDSQVRLLDANIGDIIKIIRNTPVGKSVYYRVVIDHH